MFNGTTSQQKAGKDGKLDKADVLLDLPGTKLAKGTVMI